MTKSKRKGVDEDMEYYDEGDGAEWQGQEDDDELLPEHTVDVDSDGISNSPIRHLVQENGLCADSVIML